MFALTLGDVLFQAAPLIQTEACSKMEREIDFPEWETSNPRFLGCAWETRWAFTFLPPTAISHCWGAPTGKSDAPPQGGSK